MTGCKRHCWLSLPWSLVGNLVHPASLTNPNTRCWHLKSWVASFNHSINLITYNYSHRPGEQNRPSIAGITASLDISFVSYWAQTRVQQPGLSAIQDLGSMVEVLFFLFGPEQDYDQCCRLQSNSLGRGIKHPLFSSSTTGMVSLTLSLKLFINKSIKQSQVCSPDLHTYTFQTEWTTLDAYHRTGIKKFECMFLFVTKRWGILDHQTPLNPHCYLQASY